MVFGLQGPLLFMSLENPHILLGYLALPLSFGLAAFGTAFGINRIASSLFTVGVMKPKITMRAILAMLMAGILCIYGMVTSLFIQRQLINEGEITLRKGYLCFSAGLTVGVGCLVAGYGIGTSMDSALRGLAQQERLFLPYALTLLFNEALGILSLVVSFIMLNT